MKRLYKEIFTKVMLLAVIFALVCPQVYAAPENYQWQRAEKDGINFNKKLGKEVLKHGKNFDYTYYDGITVDDSIIIEYNEMIYCIWKEENSDKKDTLRVKRYDGKNWQFIDGGKGLASGKKYVANPTAVVYNNELYILWQESESFWADDYHYLKKFNGQEWIDIDVQEDVFYRQDIYNINLTVFKNKLIMAWTQKVDGQDELCIKSYDGEKFGILHIIETNPDISNVDIVSTEKTMYITFTHKDNEGFNIVRVCHYNGSLFKYFDTLNQKRYKSDDTYELIPYNKPGLNAFNVGGGVSDAQIIVYKGEVYVCRIENTLNMMQGGWSYNNVVLVKYSEKDKNWDTVLDSDNLNVYKSGFKHIEDGRESFSNNDASSPYMTVANDKLYVIWQENQPKNKKKTSTICIKAWDGTKWDTISAGKNITANDAYDPKLLGFKGDLYTIWKENSTFLYVNKVTNKKTK